MVIWDENDVIIFRISRYVLETQISNRYEDLSKKIRFTT